MLYGSEDEVKIPLLVDIIIHIAGGTGAMAVMLAGPLLGLGMPAYAVWALNIAGGVGICALAMFQRSKRKKERL